MHAQRTEATIQAAAGTTFRVTKGAAHAVCSLLPADDAETVASINAKVRGSAAQPCWCFASGGPRVGCGRCLPPTSVSQKHWMPARAAKLAAPGPRAGLQYLLP